jgi:hypothetical protein
VHVSQTVLVVEVIIWSGVASALIMLVHEVRERHFFDGPDEK